MSATIFFLGRASKIYGRVAFNVPLVFRRLCDFTALNIAALRTRSPDHSHDQGPHIAIKSFECRPIG